MSLYNNFKKTFGKYRKRVEDTSWWKTIKYYVISLYYRLDDDHVWVMSSGIAFNLIICAIPFTLILLSVAALYLGTAEAKETIETYLNNIVGITPDLKNKIRSITLDKIYELTDLISLTGIIGIVALLWTASGLFGTIRVILNRIFKVRDDISYFKGKIKDIGMIFLVILAFLLSNSSTIVLSLIENINELILGSSFQFINQTLGFLVPVVLGFIFSFVMFYILFRLIPYGKIHKQVVNVSTWCTTIMYEALKIFYMLYVTSFTNLTAVYGIYAAIVAIILWIYYSSFVFVLGAEIGQLTYERKLKL